MGTYGRQIIGEIGHSVQLIASDFSNVVWKTGGITIDWESVTPVNGDVTLVGGTTVRDGEKYIPMGTVVSVITDTGYYGPMDTSANDGRDLISREGSFLINEDVLENTPLGIVQGNASDHPGVFKAGTVVKSRLLVGGVNQPSWEDFEAAFPGIDYATELNQPE